MSRAAPPSPSRSPSISASPTVSALPCSAPYSIPRDLRRVAAANLAHISWSAGHTSGQAAPALDPALAPKPAAAPPQQPVAAPAADEPAGKRAKNAVKDESVLGWLAVPYAWARLPAQDGSGQAGPGKCRRETMSSHPMLQCGICLQYSEDTGAATLGSNWKRGGGEGGGGGEGRGEGERGRGEGTFGVIISV